MHRQSGRAVLLPPNIERRRSGEETSPQSDGGAAHSNNHFSLIFTI